MKSFSLIKTNVGLTSNIKIVVDSNYNLYMDSIESDKILSDNKFKKVKFAKENTIDEIIPHFYKGLESEIAFAVKDDNDSNIMFTNFDKQIDDIYISGAQDITNNKYYEEDYEYFAPLYVSKSGLPKYFVIFRMDGSGLEKIDKNNFNTQILNKFKCIKIFDLTSKTALGEWLNKSYINNTQFPISGFEIDFRNNEFSNWCGIDLLNGGFTKRSYYFSDVLEFENTFNDFEKFVYDGFRKNKIVYPNILNLNFLFNDTPATPTSLRSWSINRYNGFYLENMTLVKSVSTYLPSILLDDVEIIDGNIITAPNNKPFSDSTIERNKIFVEYQGIFYEVRKIEDEYGEIKWTIISDKNLSGKESYINQNIINIDKDNKISYLDNSSFVIEDWNTADVWLIKIGDKFHNLQYDNGEYYIYTDFAFDQSSDTLSYYINSPEEKYRYTINMISGDIYNNGSIINNVSNYFTPVSFEIYKCSFSDIKYFDESIIDTDFSKFEYDLKDTVIQTDETKNYLINLDKSLNVKSEFTVNPNAQNIKNFVVNSTNLVDFNVNRLKVNIPAASHYTANNETFRLVDYTNLENASLNNLWKKNPISVKWGYKNSNSSNDYPYLLNNSFMAEDFNKTCNVFSSSPIRKERNLDYFYTINSSTMSYTHHSLHIEDVISASGSYKINNNFNFDIEEYINNNYDYFNLFFKRKAYFENSEIIKNVNKYSYFNTGDRDIPNITLFKGIKIKAFDVTNVKIINNDLQNIIIDNNNNYDDYKFSILLSKNNKTIETGDSDLNELVLTSVDNQLNWSIVDLWKYEKEYDVDDIVNYFDILYTAITTSNINDPNLNPSNTTSWTYSTNTIFWNPSKTYDIYQAGSMSNVVYNYGEYYLFNNNYPHGENTFYEPNRTYDVDDIVKYKNHTWISMTSSNTSQPDSKIKFINEDDTFGTYWQMLSNNDINGNNRTSWDMVQLWDSNIIYQAFETVIHNDILYYSNTLTTLGVEPDSTGEWTRMYSFSPDTNFIYNNTIDKNNTLFLNNRFYICRSNNNDSTLDNGITVYINKKYKNILINIYVNDNTLENLSNTDRDDLYKDLYSSLTAFNFINSLNDIKNNYGFVNKVKYVIFDGNSTKIYDFDKINSYKNLTTLLTAEGPDEFKTRVMSLAKAPVSLTSGQIKPILSLNNGSIDTLFKANYYNNIHLASVIEKVTSDSEIIPNYSGLENKIYNTLFRYSGTYDPIFKEVELFKRGLTYSNNSLFDTELNNFGIIKQFIISKVNRKGSVLKLKNSPNLKSIYPQLDEFGYTVNDMFIFKSTWDTGYFIECTPAPTTNAVLIGSYTNIGLEDNTVKKDNTDIPVKYIPVEVTPKKLF